MPEICRFFGITIKMFYLYHNPPHFHAEYGGEVVLIDIVSMSVFSGQILPRALGMVLEWTAQHQEELLADWELARAQMELRRVSPLA